MLFDIPLKQALILEPGPVKDQKLGVGGEGGQGGSRGCGKQQSTKFHLIPFSMRVVLQITLDQVACRLKRLFAGPKPSCIGRMASRKANYLKNGLNARNIPV